MSTTMQDPAAHDWRLWTVDARISLTRPEVMPQALGLVDELTGRIDEQASRFRPDSTVRRLARSGAGGLELDPLLAALLREALAAARLTDGDVDPTLGRAMQRSGYDQQVAHLPATATRPRIAVAPPRPGWRQVQLDHDRLNMPAGILLDLGATAKALAADWAARAVAEQFDCGVMVSLGGDLATAGTSPDGGWQVEVQDLPDDPRQVVTLHDGFAVATSSTQKRRWTASGQAAHHILDPRTLTPAPVVWRSVSVVAPSCATANALATASVVRGTAALRWLSGLGVAAPRGVVRPRRASG